MLTVERAMVNPDEPLLDRGDKSTRVIHLNDAEKNLPSKFRNNRISTAKYNFVTFVPKFLLEQFSKYANLFFLGTAIIQVRRGTGCL